VDNFFRVTVQILNFAPVFSSSVCLPASFVLVFLRNKEQNGQKNTSECFTTKLAYAKIQALLKKKIIHPKKLLTLVLHQAIQLKILGVLGGGDVLQEK